MKHRAVKYVDIPTDSKMGIPLWDERGSYTLHAVYELDDESGWTMTEESRARIIRYTKEIDEERSLVGGGLKNAQYLRMYIMDRINASRNQSDEELHEYNSIHNRRV